MRGQELTEHSLLPSCTSFLQSIKQFYQRFDELVIGWQLEAHCLNELYAHIVLCLIFSPIFLSVQGLRQPLTYRLVRLRQLNICTSKFDRSILCTNNTTSFLIPPYCCDAFSPFVFVLPLPCYPSWFLTAPTWRKKNTATTISLANVISVATILSQVLLLFSFFSARTTTPALQTHCAKCT